MGKQAALIAMSALVLTGACGKDKDGGGGGGGGAGTRPGKLTAQEHRSADGKLTVKGDLPSGWKAEEPLGGGVKLVQQGEGGSNEGHVQLSIAYGGGKTPEEVIKDTASVEQAYGKGSLVVPPAEIAPGRWGRVSQMVGMQWRPGIDMFEATALWKLDDQQHVRCWVRWLSKSAEGALELCKSVEVTAAAP
jgi:hypothetical protein